MGRESRRQGGRDWGDPVIRVIHELIGNLGHPMAF